VQTLQRGISDLIGGREGRTIRFSRNLRKGRGLGSELFLKTGVPRPGWGGGGTLGRDHSGRKKIAVSIQRRLIAESGKIVEREVAAQFGVGSAPGDKSSTLQPAEDPEEERQKKSLDSGFCTFGAKLGSKINSLRQRSFTFPTLLFFPHLLGQCVRFFAVFKFSSWPPPKK